MLAKMKEGFGWSYFQPRFQAYVEMSWYFGVMAIFALCSAIWAAANIDKGAFMSLSPEETRLCSKINDFHTIFSYISIFETGISFLLVVGLPAIMRSARWAAFGLTAVILLLLAYFGKLAGIVLGMTWVWAKHDISCAAVTPSLYTEATTFLVCMIILFMFQLLGGTSFLVCCGLEDALNEGLYTVNRARGKAVDGDEDAGLLDGEDDDELDHV